MASLTPHTISLKGRPMRREAAAGGAITPGHLIKYNSSGVFVVHNAGAAPHASIFAGENEVFGGDIADAYASGDRVLAWHCSPGDEVYALLAANAAAIVIGDLLESAGDGTLRLATALTGTLTGTNDGALADITFNATWSAGQANEINSNFEEIQAALGVGVGAKYMALEAVDNSANAAVVRIKAMVL